MSVATIRAIRAWMKAAVLGMALALPPVGIGPPAAVLPAAGTVAAVVTAGAALVLPDSAQARTRAGSSGGYTRPGGSFSGRTPSFGGGAPSISRTPSTGGYSRPSISIPDRLSSPGTPSASDRALSRRSASESLERYRVQQQPPTVPSERATAPRIPRTDSYRRLPERTDWYSRRGWSLPPYAAQAPRSFGVWDAVFLWFMLDTIGNPAHASFFHNHQDDPGYQSWRAEAERQAKDNAELRAKLDALDTRLATMGDQPRDPNYLPPDTPPPVALAAGAADDGGGGGFSVLPVLLVGGGALFLLWRWRRRPAPRPGGSSTMGGPLKTAADIVRRKLSGERYTPSLFRVGMTLTLDPTPFILAQDVTKVPPVPEPTGGSLLISVEAVGTLNDGEATLHRLYLPGGQSFFQLHLDAAGHPDECRYFGHIDEVTPAGEEEWAFWLDPQEGMIGWPQFQTKDGKLYQRAWAPGASRIPPRPLIEAYADLHGTRTIRRQAMLYAAATGAAPPAPETEYALVAMVEDAGQAWIEIHAGIDVNPAALSLA